MRIRWGEGIYFCIVYKSYKSITWPLTNINTTEIYVGKDSTLFTANLLFPRSKHSCFIYIPWKHTLLLLSHFSCVRLCATPETAAHQAPPSLAFSRQEHWSGLPFPSPMHESEKVKVKSLSRVRLWATPQTPPSMGFSRQGYWSGVPLPSQKHSLYTYTSIWYYNGNDYAFRFLQKNNTTDKSLIHFVFQ